MGKDPKESLLPQVTNKPCVLNWAGPEGIKMPASVPGTL
jgi:hypothetical protein